MTNRVLAGTRKALFVFDVEGDRATQIGVHFLGSPVSAVLPLNAEQWYVALNHGHFGTKLHYTDDGGASFRELAAPAYPPKPEGVEDVEPMRKQPIPWVVQQMWTLESGADASELWCGTLPGGLFRSTDSGESWELMEALWNHPGRRQWFGGGYDWPGIHSICVDPRNPGAVTIAVSCGGVWKTTDHGNTWYPHGHGLRAEYLPPERAYEPGVQDPHRMVRCRAAPDYLWIQHHNGIFRSVNDAADWTELQGTPSSFGFAAASHPGDPNVAWFVPAQKDQFRVPVDGRFGVMRTRDGGMSFEFLTEGLPTAPAYHLVYRHGLDVDGSGTTLAMGSTTGSLWIGREGGDAWHRVSAELPPIAAVRFCP